MPAERGDGREPRVAALVPPRRRRAVEPRARRSPGAIATSVVVHAALTLFLVQALRLPAPIADFFAGAPAERPVEKLTFVEPAARPAPAPEPARGPAPTPRAAPAPPARPAPARPPRLVAPTDVPDGVAPPAPTAAPTRADDGRGMAGHAEVGALSGAAAGLRPTYTASPVWRRPLFDWEEPTTTADRLDSAVVVGLAEVRDSLAREAGRRRPDDWTFERNGRKYGMDQQKIYLGPISIPTALLGVIPMRQQGSATDMQRARTTQAMSGEARDMSRRRLADDDFDARVRSIRERRERERAERRARSSTATEPTPPPDR
jgi:hypothetical protein